MDKKTIIKELEMELISLNVRKEMEGHQFNDFYRGSIKSIQLCLNLLRQ